MSVPGPRTAPTWAADLADRPLGPFFEARFTVGDLCVHAGVVRGSVDLLDLARDRAHELTARWQQPVPRLADPETLLLVSLAEEALPWLAPGERVRRLAPALTADLVVQELLDEGALGACVRVADDAAFVGIPPRPQGWRVQVPGEHELPRQIVVLEGGVSTRGNGGEQVTVTADRAWRAAAEAERRVAQPVTAGSGRASRSTPA